MADGSKMLTLFPVTAEVNSNRHLCIGECDLVNVAEQYGTPLYVFDEETIRQNCSEFKTEFTVNYPGTLIAYAAKAFISRKLAQIAAQEGLGLDVVSGGDISIARSVDFPMKNVHFNGNNKLESELEMAIDYGVGCIVVDNFYELTLLNRIAAQRGVRQDIMLRINPGVDPHTHKHTSTGILDSKFGFPLATGQSVEAVKEAMLASNLDLVGLHFHLGSPLFTVEPYLTAIDLVLGLAAEMREKFKFQCTEFSIGGGFAVPYLLSDKAPSISSYAQAIAERIMKDCSSLGIEEPHLTIEPGRAIIARAGVAIYRVGAIKDIPGVRNYVCLDGGMSDNIRPALYDAKYEAVVANKINDNNTETVTLVGKLCESGDIRFD